MDIFIHLLQTFNECIIQMKSIKLLKPQPSPTNTRNPLKNITNFFHSKEKMQKQNYRAPSLSPRNTPRASDIGKQLKKDAIAKGSFEKNEKSHKEGNHSNRQRKTKRVTTVSNEEGTSQMVLEAKQYISSCNHILTTLSQKFRDLSQQRSIAESRFLKAQEEIEKERHQVILKINERYNRQLSQQEDARRKTLQQIQQKNLRFKELQKEFQTVKADISENINEMDRRIRMAQFRQIMDLYWSKIQQFNEIDLKNNLNEIMQSSQTFVSKYLPPFEAKNSRSRTFEGDVKKSSAARDDTFNKKMWNLQNAKGTFSWEQKSPVTDSSESVVERRIKLR